jgi:hypothetical protein
VEHPEFSGHRRRPRVVVAVVSQAPLAMKGKPRPADDHDEDHFHSRQPLSLMDRARKKAQKTIHNADSIQFLDSASRWPRVPARRSHQAAILTATRPKASSKRRRAQAVSLSGALLTAPGDYPLRAFAIAAEPKSSGVIAQVPLLSCATHRLQLFRLLAYRVRTYLVDLPLQVVTPSAAKSVISATVGSFSTRAVSTSLVARRVCDTAMAPGGPRDAAVDRPFGEVHGTVDFRCSLSRRIRWRCRTGWRETPSTADRHRGIGPRRRKVISRWITLRWPWWHTVAVSAGEPHMCHRLCPRHQ